MSSKPLEIRRSSNSNATSAAAIASSPAPSNASRHSRRTSMARLGSPVLGKPHMAQSPVRQIPTPIQRALHEAELPDPDEDLALPAPGRSALSTALAGTSKDFAGARTASPQARPNPVSGGSHDKLGSPRIRPHPTNVGSNDKVPHSNYGSFDNREMAGSPLPSHDPEIIKRHLVHFESSSGLRKSIDMPIDGAGSGNEPDEFSSLRLQGGDMTRQIYRWAEESDSTARGRAKRSQSFHVSRPEPEEETLDRKNILIPGGFRRNFLRRAADSPAPSAQGRNSGSSLAQSRGNNRSQRPLFTNNFLEFLTLYGHFAGEDLEEDDEVLEPDEYFSSEPWDPYPEGREPGEDSALLTPGTPGLRRRRPRERATQGTNSVMNAALLMLKSFVGTGVLFLPRAFLNGGMLFSSLMLLGVALLSYYSFILLLETRAVVQGSLADMGSTTFGKPFRTLILISLVISQIGFVSAYTVFVAENLQAFVLSVTNCRTFIDIKYYILMQQAALLPISLVRDIGKLGFTALIAEFFILLGLIYLYYFDILTLVQQGGIADIKLFNPKSWTLLIGTAIFTFEGVGLVIPIQESMARPDKFPFVLSVTLAISTVIFTSIAVLCYAAFGSKTQTVILLNLPQDSPAVSTIQLLYSIAILLSTPIQLFPAIRIIENEFFTRSGKYNPYIKWQKNIFRFFFVLLCALIAFGGANDLDKFVSLSGSFACVPLCFVYPPLMHRKAVAKTRKQVLVDYLMFAIGIVGCIYATTLTITQWAASSGGGSSKLHCIRK